jgi:periplasmic protein TonB
VKRRRRPRRFHWPALAGDGARGIDRAVFEQRFRRSRRPLQLGVLVAVLYGGGLGTWAALAERPAAPPPPPPELAVELFEPPPPPPPPPEPPPEPPPPRAQPAAAAPAQAAEVLAAEPEPAAAEPEDLTAFTITTGNAERFAGGKTASNGSSTAAVPGAVSARGVPGGTGTGDRDLSSPVRIRDHEWDDCAWPAEADALGIDEQTVSIRAVVRSDGSMETAEIVSDPGNGFGAALLACARRHGFQPARDATGSPIRARSGVIRFTFTR